MKTQKTVLVVEDEKDIRDGLVYSLRRKKFFTLEAANGKEGVEIALAKHPDLVLLDLLMPEMDGTDALKKIREDAWGAHIPVIVLTNVSMNEERLVKDMVAYKPLYYLIKVDWTFSAVAEKVEEALTPNLSTPSLA